MENKFKGTKGKWQSENVITHNGDFFKVKCGDLAICNITTRNQTFARANAQLISKSPELLEKLIEIDTALKHNTFRENESYFRSTVEFLIKEATTI